MDEQPRARRRVAEGGADRPRLATGAGTGSSAVGSETKFGNLSRKVRRKPCLERCAGGFRWRGFRVRVRSRHAPGGRGEAAESAAWATADTARLSGGAGREDGRRHSRPAPPNNRAV